MYVYIYIYINMYIYIYIYIYIHIHTHTCTHIGTYVLYLHIVRTHVVVRVLASAVHGRNAHRLPEQVHDAAEAPSGRVHRVGGGFGDGWFRVWVLGLRG